LGDRIWSERWQCGNHRRFRDLYRLWYPVHDHRTFPVRVYRVQLRVRIPATVLSSGTYWVNITPQCTDSGNSSCSVSQYYFDNTFGLNRYGPLEPADEGFFNSGYFGYDYANDCTVSSTGCQRFRSV